MNVRLSFTVTKGGEVVAWIIDDSNGIHIYTVRIPSAIAQASIDTLARHLNEHIKIRRAATIRQLVERQRNIRASARTISITHDGVLVRGWLEPGRAGKELFVITIRSPLQFAGREVAQYRNPFCGHGHDNSGNWLPASLAEAEELLCKLYQKALHEQKHSAAYIERDELEAIKGTLLRRLW